MSAVRKDTYYLAMQDWLTTVIHYEHKGNTLIDALLVLIFRHM